VRGAAGCCWGGGTRNGVWQAPHASRPNVPTVVVTAAASFATAWSRSVPARFSRFFAAAWNSGHFCQISGFAFDLSVSDPSGKRPGIRWAWSDIASAFAATA